MLKTKNVFSEVLAAVTLLFMLRMNGVYTKRDVEGNAKHFDLVYSELMLCQRRFVSAFAGRYLFAHFRLNQSIPSLSTHLFERQFTTQALTESFIACGNASLGHSLSRNAVECPIIYRAIRMSSVNVAFSGFQSSFVLLKGRFFRQLVAVFLQIVRPDLSK